MTEENQTVTTTMTPAPTRMGPNIKRHIQLYQYGIGASSMSQPLRRFLGKKGLKAVKAIIYDDSTMKVFDESKMRDPTLDLKLENVALFVAFGKAANKYGPPPINEEEANFISPSNFFAVPENQERQKVHWFAAKDERSLKDLIQAIAETVEGKVNPPQLGKGPKFRYSHDDLENKWKTYWITCAQQPPTLEAAEENGAESKYVATPLVAVLDEQKKAAAATAAITPAPKPEPESVSPPAPEEKKDPSPPSRAKSILKPLPLLRHHPPPRDYYKVENVPEEAQVLEFQPEFDGLLEDESTREKIVSIRLEHGKRIKEIKEKPAPAPPSSPPPAVPEETERAPELHVVEEETKLELAIAEPEAVPLIKEEGNLIPLEDVPQQPVNSEAQDEEKKEENVEIFTSQHSTVVNVANTEHTITTTSTEYHVSANGVNATAVH